MLTIIQSGFYADTSRELRLRIEARMREGKESILLVPEQQTVTAESEYAEHLPADAPLTFEVTNFTRLPNRIFREIGGLADNYSDATVKALYMWRTLTELSPMLGTQFSRVSEGTVEKALSAYREMHSLCLDAALLSEASEAAKEGHPRLSEKLFDLSKILALFRALHGEKYKDSGEDILALSEMIPLHPQIFADTEIFIDGFTSFTEIQYRVLDALLRVTNITMTLRIPKNAEDGLEYAEPRAVREKLTALCHRIDCPVKLKKVDGSDEADALLQNTLPLLWKANTYIDNDCLQNSTNSLKIYKCPTPYDMATFITQDILRRVQEEGCRFRDFAIVYSKASASEGLIDAALHKAGIPSTLHTRHDVSAFEAIKLIECAYAAVSSNFRRSDVLAYAKCGLCGLSRGDICELELYCERWQIEGRGFSSELLWNMNPLGYGAEETEQTQEALKKINAAKEALMRPLLVFAEDTRQAKTVREHAQILTELLLSLSMEQGLAKRASRLREFGESEAAEENERLFSVICRSLDKLVEVMGDFKADEKVFRSLLGIVFRSVDLGHIPALFDCVCAGTADLLRPADIKHVYLCGVNAGEFPMNPSESGLLTVSDKECLNALGFGLEASREIQSARELFSFSRAFAMGRKSVSLLYTEKNSSYGITPPADVIARICDMSAKKILPIDIDLLTADRRFYTPTSALEGFDRMTDDERAVFTEALRQTGHGAALQIMERRLENDSLKLKSGTASLLYRGAMALTQSRLDSYVQCPFKHFCTYTLRLTEERRARLDNLNIGTFLHAILERFLSDIKKEGISHDSLTAEERKARVQAVAKEESDRLLRCGGTRAKRESLQIQRLTRAAEVMAESLCREFSHKDGFAPAFFELKIGGTDGPQPPTLHTKDGEAVYIYGTIDRVDALRAGDDVYLRVVDYKTGKKAFSPSDLDKGENIQMFLYLRALTENPGSAVKDALGIPKDGRILPAGAVYMNALTEDKNQPSPPPEDRKISMADSRAGMLLDDPVSIAGMNPDFLPIKYNKDGSVSATSKKNLYSLEEWDRLMDSLGEVVEGIADRMKGGDISALPKKQKNMSPCEHCAYKAICRNSG